MPTFPTYHGKLPQCLNPLNPRHYLLLAYWVFFRPSALKRYLYQADPELYRAETRSIAALHIPAHRNLYVMAPVVTALLSVTVGLPLVLLINRIYDTSIIWPGLLGSIAGSIIFGLVMNVAFSIAFGRASGVAGNVAFGVASGISASLAFGLASNIPSDIVTFVTLFVAFGITWGLAFDVTVGAGRFVAGGAALGIAMGMIGGMALSVIGFRTGNITIGITTWAISSIIGVATFGAGASRVIFYPLHILLTLCGAGDGKRHSLEWDDLTVLPVPGARQALIQRLQHDERDGLRFVAQVTYNPFQRWTAQAALQSYLHSRPLPIHFIYTLLTDPDLDTYVPAPVSENDWNELPSVRRLLLGELDRRQVKYGRDWAYWLADRLVWNLTWMLCDRRITPLTRFAGMLYELLEGQETPKNLTSYADIYTGLTGYPGGEEIARTFEAMAAYLSYEELSALPAARNLVFQKKPGFSPIRPTVLTALNQLRQVGAEIAAYRDATSRVSKLAALARATDALDDLDEYTVVQVMAPEQYILRRIIRQWRRLVSEAGGEVGRAEEVGPVANPYVAGNPVTGELFVGRQDIMRRLEELWSGTGQKPSVVLYGHRRMGKSSILHNLGARFGPRTVIVDFNMQRVGLVASTGELLYNLALALCDAVETRNLVSPEPDEERFTTHNPYTGFDRFLKRLGRVRADHRFIVTVDEFELIEQLIADGTLEPHLLDFWRGLIQTYPWFVMAFAGLHTLQEMTRDYWHPLYGSVTPIPVSFLGHTAAWQLITQPTPEFSLDYDNDAVERIIRLTNGQPYLVQLIGHGLVTRFNRQTFEQGKERERRFNLADVEAVVNAPEFYRDGDAYFTGVWRQAETSDPSGQTAVLIALARSETGMSADEIAPCKAARSELAPETATGALETLARHDVVMEKDGGWRFTVELMRRWVAQKGASREVTSA